MNGHKKIFIIALFFALLLIFDILVLISQLL